MGKNVPALRAVHPVLFALGCAITWGSAVAQQAGEQEVQEEVTVEAVREVQVGRTSTGIPITEVTIKRRVSYADLNLATPEGGKELEKRVHDTAKETCQELDRKYPLTEPGPGSKDCFERAKDDGMRQAQDAIRMAKRQPVAVETD